MQNGLNRDALLAVPRATLGRFSLSVRNKLRRVKASHVQRRSHAPTTMIYIVRQRQKTGDKREREGERERKRE